MVVKASIIIPVYNAEDTVRRAIDSAVNQTTDEPYEVILIDDGSKDESAAILDEYADRYAYVRVIHQDNQGITRTRENGIKISQGEFVFWVDSDDYADAHLLEKTLPLLESGADVVIYGTQYFCEKSGKADNRIRKNISDATYWKQQALNANLSTIWTYGTRRRFWEGESAPSEVARSAADGYMTIRIFGKAESFHVLPDILYYHLVDSPFSIRHTFNGKRYLGNAFLWYYRLKCSEKQYPENTEACAARAMSGYIKAYAMDTVTHDLTEEDRQNIIKALQDLKRYSISGRIRDKLLGWAILHNQLWLCRIYAQHKNSKTQQMNKKMKKLIKD